MIRINNILFLRCCLQCQ